MSPVYSPRCQDVDPRENTCGQQSNSLVIDLFELGQLAGLERRHRDITSSTPGGSFSSPKLEDDTVMAKWFCSGVFVDILCQGDSNVVAMVSRPVVL